YHKSNVFSAIQLMGAAGIRRTEDLRRSFIYRRVGPNEIETFEETYPEIPEGSLVNTPYPSQYERDMALSGSSSFMPMFENISVVTPQGASPVSNVVVSKK